MKSPARQRLDQALVERSLCPSREQAQRLILAGQVRVNATVAHKPALSVRASDVLEVVAPPRYVSRGGLKLEHALTTFALEVQHRIALDVGASTGGFTDCLLQHGAPLVYAIDVGRGQLAWKLRQDPRVVVLDQTNARHLTRADFPPGFGTAQFAAVDCSFISLRLVLPPVAALLDVGSPVIALIKPQFEAGRAEVSRGAGVIRDPAIHEQVLAALEGFVQRQPGLCWRASTPSPILGPAGNREFLALLEKTA